MQPNIDAGLRITALVSVGKHPCSGRARRADSKDFENLVRTHVTL